MKKKTFKISHKVIWLSSFFLGILTSVPKIAEHRFNPYEALVDSTVTFLFAVLIWYYNVMTLPAYSSRDVASGFSIMIHGGNGSNGQGKTGYNFLPIILWRQMLPSAAIQLLQFINANPEINDLSAGNS